MFHTWFVSSYKILYTEVNYKHTFTHYGCKNTRLNRRDEDLKICDVTKSGLVKEFNLPW